MTTVWVSLAAGLGAVLRYLADRLVQRRHRSPFPWGTVLINVTGAFGLGLLTGLGLHHGWPGEAVTVLGTGVLGGYTTWSTFVWESVALTENGDALMGILNVLGSLVLGLAAAAAGLGLALA